MRASIITPIFNGLPYVEHCVANVLAQGAVVFEHIIVDGGSTDGTVDRITELQSTTPNLIYVAGPDRGQSDALNKGVARATGDIIGVLNADDRYEPGAVAEAVRWLESIPAPALVVGDCKLTDAQGSKWNRPKDLRFEALMLGYDYAQWPNNPAAYFYHRSVHDIVGMYDVADHYTMDLDFVFRCARDVHTRYVARHWGNFILHPGCKTFEDDEGPVRQQRLFDRFHSSMSDAQRRKMDEIRIQKHCMLKAKRALRRVGALKVVNDWIKDKRAVR